MTSILIVDDHPIVRDGLEVLLASEKDFKIHGTVASAEEALALCGKKGPPDARRSPMEPRAICRRARRGESSLLRYAA